MIAYGFYVKGEGIQVWRERMKKYLLNLLTIVFMFFAQQCNLYAGVRDINGTAGIKYVNYNQVFPKGISLANGFVRFNAGFTITSTATAQLDTFITVSAGMDIRNTGTLDLLSDLYLSSNFTFSTYDTIGGFIKGRGNTIHFGGNVKLQQGKTLQFIGDTIIDGGGNIFDLGSFSQLLVDHNVTLTLKNMEFRNKHNSVCRPSIRLTSPSSKLALQNVNFALADEFAFREGQLFIHSDVMITGTSMFSYRSAAHSYIDRNSGLLFDKGTTYFHYPKVATNDQWYMKDASSLMAFDNASLFTTHTGMKLTRGTLYFDNGVTVSSFAAYPNKVNSLSLLGSSVIDPTFTGLSFINSYSTEWSHNQQFIAVAARNIIKVYTVGQSSIVSQTDFTDVDFDSINIISWSNDDRYLLIAGKDALFQGLVKIYSFDGLSIISATNLTTNTNFSDLVGGAWSMDNRYVIIVGTGTNNYSVYLFNGTSLSLVIGAFDIDFPFAIAHVSISTDNRYVAFSSGGSGTGVLKIFSFNAGILTPIGSALVDPTFGINGFSKSLWSFDNKYLFSYGRSGSGHKLIAHQFNGLTLTPVASVLYGSAIISTKQGMQFSADARNIVVLNGDNTFTIFEFTGSSFIEIVNISDLFAIVLFDVDWSPDGNFIFALGSITGFEVTRSLYKVNYRHDTSTQGIRNGIVFGDASLGPDYDLDVEVLGCARVEIDGKMLYDNAS